MPAPARNTLAIVGAGPIGLETAVAALDAGFDVHVFERGEVASHPLAWGHVRMFTPWRMNVGPATRAHLERSGWTMPDPETCPTGRELAERCLEPLAALPELAGRVHTFAQVTHVSRHATLKGDGDAVTRATRPFRLLIRDQGGRENFIHAWQVIDASGVYGQPNWAGDGGIPARQELYLAPQMSYHVDDVLGLGRERYAGRRTLVIGSGASAATTVRDLAVLAGEAPGTAVTWVTRGRMGTMFPLEDTGALPELRALRERARALLDGACPHVAHIGGAVVEGFEYNSATHRYRVRLMLGDTVRLEEADRVVVNTGFHPDDTLYRELQVRISAVTDGPDGIAAVVLASNRVPGEVEEFGFDVLGNPEPDFFILGQKSYGRRNGFLLGTGFRQVTDVIAHLARGLGTIGIAG
ncbi:MAG: flavoprotein [Candidatus Eisenbacteria bacterium]